MLLFCPSTSSHHIFHCGINRESKKAKVSPIITLMSPQQRRPSFRCLSPCCFCVSVTLRASLHDLQRLSTPSTSPRPPTQQPAGRLSSPPHLLNPRLLFSRWCRRHLCRLCAQRLLYKIFREKQGKEKKRKEKKQCSSLKEK